MNKPVQITRHTTDDFVSHIECLRNHSLLKWTITVLFALMTLMIGIVGYAARASAIAIDNTLTLEKHVEEVDSNFKVYAAEDKSQSKQVVEMLSEIKDELKSQRVEQKRLFEKILQVDKLPK